MYNPTTPYGFGAAVDLPFADAVERTTEALAAEGFGVLAEIDIASTLRQKLGVDVREYVILGACNPPLAYKALASERNIGLLLPCNVVVYAADEPGRSVVAAMDPRTVLALTRNPALTPLAEDVARRLQRALAAVAGTTPHGSATEQLPTPPQEVEVAEEIC